MYETSGIPEEQKPVLPFAKPVKPKINPSDYTIAVVDDDIDQRTLIKFILETAGFNVADLSSTDECLQIMTRKFIDLVVCDIMMPGTNGIDFVKHVKSLHMIPSNATLPVILVTAQHEGREDEALNAGADKFCLKRYAQSELVKHVYKLLE